MGVALHAYLVGQPHRLRHLKRALRHIAKHRERHLAHHAGRDRATLHGVACGYRSVAKVIPPLAQQGEVSASYADGGVMSLTEASDPSVAV